MATAASAQEVAPNSNQMTANAVAGSLRSSRALAGHRIEIMARDGVVTLSGTLASPAQKSEALARAGRVAGRVRRGRPAPGRRPIGPPGPVSAQQFSRSSTSPSYQPELALGHHRRNYDGGAPMYDESAMAPPPTPTPRS